MNILTKLSISQIHRGLKKKEFSVLELTEAYLEKIKKQNKKISAYLTVAADLALSRAKNIDDMIKGRKDFPVLAGVPLAVKDVILVRGLKSTAGSRILENYIAPYDATAVKRLKEQGAVILGKTNTDEFAMGSSTENSAFGPSRNPHDPARVPGGSSGGSAAAVAADLCCFALGSDTGGSVRQPASFCGVVGFKPTYGTVSRYGLIAFASSLDQIGPISKTVEDAEIVFEAIFGKDEKDSTSVEKGFLLKKKRLTARDLVVGVPKEYFVKGMDPEVEKNIREAIKAAEKAGAKIRKISLPHTEYALACYYIIAPSEASANLARYDGIKYGLAESAGDLMEVYFKTRGKGFGKEVKRRIMLGTYTLSSGYYEAYYLRALKVRALIKNDFEKAFRNVNLILTPTSPTPAFKIGEKTKDPLTMYLSDIFTVSVNLAGLPALSLPWGKAGNLPVGLQLIGRSFQDRQVLLAGKLFERLAKNKS
jgi:aspartyl-tRNA(Asn)/glutamyl-tRNA(Gln) amidotransferase subunit A